MEPSSYPLCAICYTDLEGSPALSQSACGCRYHTACVIRHVATSHYWIDIACPCGATLYQRPPHHAGGSVGSDHSTQGSPSPEVTAVLSNPTALAERKELRRIIRAFHGAARARQRLIHEHVEQFKLETAPLLQQIRASRVAHLHALASSQEEKAARSLYGKARRAYTRFRTTYGLGRQDMCRLRIPFQYSRRLNRRGFYPKV